MGNRSARWVVVEDDFADEEPLVIKDVGPWDERLTITNDAEEVVRTLVAEGRLPIGRRLFYIDSEGEKDEILMDKTGRFSGFAPGTERP